MDVLERHDRRRSCRRLEDAQGDRERRGGDGVGDWAVPPIAIISRAGPAATIRHLHVSDIVLGATSVNIGAFKTGTAGTARGAALPTGGPWIC